MSELDERIDNALDELKEWMIDNPGEDADDEIFEIADSSCPIMNYDILQCAVDDMDLALTEPEIGPAFDGSPTAINIIAANIFEKIRGELWEYYNNHKDDYLDEIDEEELEEL